MPGAGWLWGGEGWTLVLRVFLFGRRGSGKSTVAQFLAGCTGARVYKVSGPLYWVAEELFGMEGKDRRLLQALGDKFREIDPDCLLRCLSAALERDRPRVAVVEDVRLPREAEWLRRMGFAGVLVRAPEPVRLARLAERGEDVSGEEEGHATEAGVEAIVPEYVLENAGTLKDLRNAVRALVGEMVYWQVASRERAVVLAGLREERALVC